MTQSFGPCHPAHEASATNTTPTTTPATNTAIAALRKGFRRLSPQGLTVTTRSVGFR